MSKLDDGDRDKLFKYYSKYSDAELKGVMFQIEEYFDRSETNNPDVYYNWAEQYNMIEEILLGRLE